MPRPGVTPEFLEALSAQLLRPALFVEAYFTSGPVRVWNGLGTIAWNGFDWTGIGTLGSVSAIEEGATVEARGISLTMSGIDPALLTLVLGEFRQGLPVSVWLGLFRADGTLIPDPVLSFAGRTDQPTTEVSGETATLTITCENRLIDMHASVERRYTNEDQQLDYPGDRGFEFVASIQSLQINWGRSPSSNN